MIGSDLLPLPTIDRTATLPHQWFKHSTQLSNIEQTESSPEFKVILATRLFGVARISNVHDTPLTFAGAA
jgi:hypothetical protein